MHRTMADVPLVRGMQKSQQVERSTPSRVRSSDHELSQSKVLHEEWLECTSLPLWIQVVRHIFLRRVRQHPYHQKQHRSKQEAAETRKRMEHASRISLRIHYAEPQEDRSREGEGFPLYSVHRVQLPDPTGRTSSRRLRSCSLSEVRSDLQAGEVEWNLGRPPMNTIFTCFNTVTV